MKTKKEMTVSEMGRIGGRSTQKKYGKKHYIKMGKLSGVSKRRNKKASVNFV